jgi:hypothetical protein
LGRLLAVDLGEEPAQQIGSVEVILRTTGLAPPTDVELASARTPQHRQPISRIEIESTINEEVIRREDSVAVSAEVSFEHSLWLECCAFVLKGVDAFLELVVKHQSRAASQLRQVPVLKANEQLDERPPSLI